MKDCVTALIELHDERLVVGDDSGNIHLYELFENQYVPRKSLELGSAIVAFALLSSGALIIGCQNGNIYLFENNRMFLEPIEEGEESFIPGGLLVHSMLGLISARDSIRINPNYGCTFSWGTRVHAAFPVSFRLAACALLILARREETMGEAHNSTDRNHWLRNLGRLPLELIFQVLECASTPITEWTSRGRGLFSALPTTSDSQVCSATISNISGPRN